MVHLLCTLQLCLIHLLDLVADLVDDLRFSAYTVILSANNKFTPSFQIFIPFISFYYAIIVARTSSTMLTRSIEVDTLALFTVLGEEVLSLSLLSIIAVGVF